MSARRLQEALKDEFTLRIAVVPGYSLNEFASDLELSPTQLSKALLGKVILSEEIIAKISAILKWPDDIFKKPAMKPKISKTAKTATQSKKITVLKKESQITMVADIENESFKIMSDWYHYAILELIQLKDFNPDIKYVSERLNIDLATAQNAVHRLIDLKLLEISKNGTWHNTSRYHSMLKSFDTDSASRQFQLQILEKAYEAQKTSPSHSRAQTAMTFAISKTKLDEAKTKIIEFQKQLISSLTEENASPDEVFHLTFSLFSLSGTNQK